MLGLNNFSISIKTLVSPLFSCAMVLVISVIFYFTSADIRSAVQANQDAVSFSNSANQAKLKFANAHSDLYKAFDWQQTDADPKQINAALEEAKQYLIETKDLINSLDYKKFNVDDAIVKQLNSDLKAYTESVSQFLEIATIDKSMSSFFVNDCQSRYDPAQNTLNILVSAADNESKSIRDSLAVTVNDSLIIFFSCAALSVLLSLGIGIAIGRAIARPIQGLTKTMHELANGNKRIEIDDQSRRDEIGEMARATQVFKEELLRAAELEMEKEKTRQAKEARNDRLTQISKTFSKDAESVLTEVTSAITKLQVTASTMSETAEQTLTQAATVAAATEQASTNVQTVASSAEELSSSIGEIGRQISQSAKIAVEASTKNKHANTLIESLSQSAQRIGDAVKLIDNIASQTNLLALNATIEAARAGDAGKGFSVVASEVKTLALQTGKATEEIAQQVASVQTATGDTINAIQSIGSTITEINKISAEITNAITEQGHATEEIARNVQQAAVGTQQVSYNIVSVNEAATNTGHAANDVLNAAADLNRESEKLRRIVNNYLNDMRED